jgi:hypothetical protein
MDGFWDSARGNTGYEAAETAVQQASDAHAEAAEMNGPEGAAARQTAGRRLADAEAQRLEAEKAGSWIVRELDREAG